MKKGIPMTDSTMTLRLATTADEGEIRRIAALDTSPAPASPALLATENGRLVAAISLCDGIAVADPFVPSKAALDLLRVRAAHLRPGRLESTGLWRRVTSFAGRRRARPRAALAGSPPGAGGRLLDLSDRYRAASHPR